MTPISAYLLHSTFIYRSAVGKFNDVASAKNTWKQEENTEEQMKYASNLNRHLKCTPAWSCVQFTERIRGHATCTLDVVERKVSALVNPNRIKFLKNEDNDDDDTKKEKDREREVGYLPCKIKCSSSSLAEKRVTYIVHRFT